MNSRDKFLQVLSKQEWDVELDHVEQEIELSAGVFKRWMRSGMEYRVVGRSYSYDYVSIVVTVLVINAKCLGWKIQKGGLVRKEYELTAEFYENGSHKMDTYNTKFEKVVRYAQVHGANGLSYMLTEAEDLLQKVVGAAASVDDLPGATKYKAESLLRQQELLKQAVDQ